MGIRETLNKNPGITTGATAGIIVLALIFILWQTGIFGDSTGIQTEAYYTIDDGTTYFADDVNKIPPFEKDGKQAVRAYVYECPGSDPFVAYLERYTPQAKKAMEAAASQTDPNSNPMLMEDVQMTGLEVKKPGDKAWVRQANAPAAAKVMELKCPDGTTEGLELVMP